MNYMNTLFMAIFGGTKETSVKFIISWYHKEKFYFDRLVEISGEVIYKLTGLSNQGDPVLVDIRRTGRTINWNAIREKFKRAND